MRTLRIAIPGEQEDVSGYIRVLHDCGAQAQAMLTVPDPMAFDGLVIPGGEDIDPARYGQENTGCRVIDPVMDALQFDALDVFVRAGKPVLGICNGMQMINIYFGGDLIQDLETKEMHQRDPANRTDVLHWCSAQPGSWVEKLYGPRFLGNSAHHQGLGRPGNGIRIVSRADDGVAEGLRHETLPVYGLQWHPERLTRQTGQLERRKDGCAPVDGEKVYRFFLSVAASLRDEAS